MKAALSFFLALFTGILIAQKPITTVPFELFGDHIILEVSVDDSDPLSFIFDTGSGYTVLDSDVADRLDLPAKDIEMNATGTEWQLIKHNTLAVNDFLMEKNIKVYATDLNHLEISLGRELDGILGYDLLKHHSVYINFDKKEMSIYDHSGAPTNGDPIPFELNVSIPTIKGSVVLNNGETIAGDFFVMTGAGATLDFNTPFSTNNDIISKTGKHYSYYIKGVGQKENLHYEGHVESLKFGKQTIEDLPIGISTSKSGIQGNEKVAGIIGSQVLRLYNMTIDYGTKMIYLTKDETYEPFFNVNCSGIDVQLSTDKKKVLIHRVFENSPAKAAGIAVNAELIKINGKSMASINLPEIKKTLRKDGENVQLVVKQNGEEREFNLDLKSLLN
ncbi:MAG: aspartyl protease family protein [Bacteroidota bacterium]